MHSYPDCKFTLTFWYLNRYRNTRTQNSNFPSDFPFHLTTPCPLPLNQYSPDFLNPHEPGILLVQSASLTPTPAR